MAPWPASDHGAGLRDLPAGRVLPARLALPPAAQSHSAPEGPAEALQGAREGAAHRERQPFFDLTVLRSRTVQILLLGSALSAFGVHTPFFLLVNVPGPRGGADPQRPPPPSAVPGAGLPAGLRGPGAGGGQEQRPVPDRAPVSGPRPPLLVMAGILAAFVSPAGYSGYVLFAWVYGFFHGGTCTPSRPSYSRRCGPGTSPGPGASYRAARPCLSSSECPSQVSAC
ncbi:hypothetical protein CEXT_696271 [Caerostris extrusa]|uniref:Uncharacterized protein n=1 Tax=Caerostris extrusa TaxID=172846 RepID=A0AAV4XI33_CAEEX|nr:hypothetical protein CEXT_696271 [Caerostris extrusa]